MRFRFIDAEKANYPVTIMCRVMQVSTSGYYVFISRPQSRHTQKDAQLAEEISHYHKESRGRYGSPRIHGDLIEAGRQVGRKRVERLMREAGLQGKRTKKFRCLTDSGHGKEVAPNLLGQAFDVQQPNAVWVSDLTEFWTPDGKLYLAVVLDLFARYVVGFAMGTRITRHLVLEAVAMALLSRKPGPGLIVHSDRGSQYAADDTKRLLAENGITASMSGTGNCYDNAVAESLFARLKEELGDSFPSRDQGRLDLFEYLAVFFNRRRRHSYNGNLTPLQCEEYYAQHGRRPDGLKAFVAEQRSVAIHSPGKGAPSRASGLVVCGAPRYTSFPMEGLHPY